MTPNTDTFAQLQNLVQTDPALQERLKTADSPEAAGHLIAQAAQEKGLSVDAGEIAARLRAVQERLTQGELSDEQLEAVAGGISGGGMIALSIATAILGCELYSGFVGFTSYKGGCKGVEW